MHGMSTTTAPAQVPAHVQAVRTERAADPIVRRHDLCLDCTATPAAAIHQPGYRMHRTAYDSPGHAHVSYTTQEAPAMADTTTAQVTCPDCRGIGGDGQEGDCGPCLGTGLVAAQEPQGPGPRNWSQADMELDQALTVATSLFSLNPTVPSLVIAVSGGYMGFHREGWTTGTFLTAERAQAGLQEVLDEAVARADARYAQAALAYLAAPEDEADEDDDLHERGRDWEGEALADTEAGLAWASMERESRFLDEVSNGQD